MSFVNAFKPSGPTVLVGTTSVQCITTDNCYAISYRVRNKGINDAYIAWAPQLPLNKAVVVSPAEPPADGVPSNNVIGISPGGVEVITLPANAWFIANIADSFEVTPGEGL